MIEKIGDWNFGRTLKAFEALKRNDIPLLVGKLAQNHFIEGFAKGGHQTDASEMGWEERQSKDRSDKRNEGNRAILVKSGHLRRSISLLEYKFDRIIIGTRGIKYAEIHNEGGTVRIPERQHKLSFNSSGRFSRQRKAAYQQMVTMKGHSFRMPKREYIGKSMKLDEKIISLLNKKIDEVWK